MVVAGGQRIEGTTAGCWMLSAGSWRPIPPMSSPRSMACSVIIDNEMWVMGGLDSRGNAVATVEVYSPKTNSWRSCTPMSQRRYAAVAGVVGGRLVVAGGAFGGEGTLTSVEAYTGTGWTQLPPMPRTVWNATACVLNERLYVVGGHPGKKLQVLEMTDFGDGRQGLLWSCKAELPATRSDAASFLHEGRISVMGGYVGGAPSNSVVAYDAEADAWNPCPPLPRAIPTGICNAATSPNGPFLNSGGRVFQYRNGAWLREARSPAPAVYPMCGSVLLG